MLNLLKNPDQRHRMCAAARTFAKRYDWDTVSGEWEAMYAPCNRPLGRDQFGRAAPGEHPELGDGVGHRWLPLLEPLQLERLATPEREPGSEDM